MNSVTFTETRSNGENSYQTSIYRLNHMHRSENSPSHQHQHQHDRQIIDPLAMAAPLSETKAMVADVAMMIDCRSVCEKHLGVDVPWLGHVWFVKDICGQVCAIITWLLLVYAEFAVMVVVVPEISFPYNIINAVGYNFFAFLALASHIRVTLTDPGAVVKGSATYESLQKMGLKEGEVVYRCPKCVAIKPPRAHHCSVCQRCVRKMDHHCPWVNNCIGENNQKYFVLFTLYICVICFHAFIMAFIHFLSCFSAPRLDWMDSRFSPLTTVFLLVFLLFESIAFGIFTGSMLWSQLSAVFSDETGIEQLKKQPARWEKKSRWMSLKSVFGHPFTWHWFSPFATPQMACSRAHLHTV